MGDEVSVHVCKGCVLMCVRERKRERVEEGASTWEEMEQVEEAFDMTTALVLDFLS